MKKKTRKIKKIKTQTEMTSFQYYVVVFALFCFPLMILSIADLSC